MRLGPPPPGRRIVAWGFGAIGLSFLLQIFTSLPLALFFKSNGRTSTEITDSPGFLAASVILAGFCGIGAFWIARHSMGWSVPDSGVRRGIGFWPSFGMTFGVLIGFGLVSRGWERLVHPPKDSHVVIKALEEHPAFGIAALFALGAGVIAPIAEELLFRGLLYRSLTRFGQPIALVGSGALFGALHVGAVPAKLLPLLAFLGLLLALLYAWTGSVIPSMCLHAFINSSSVGQTTGATDGQRAAWTYSTLALAWGTIALLRHRWRNTTVRESVDGSGDSSDLGRQVAR